MSTVDVLRPLMMLRVVRESERKYTASFVASDAAMISASHEDSAAEGCFLDAHEMAAWLYKKTYPEVECLVAQSESEYPCMGISLREKRSPTER
eukprot:6137320-Pleurochrysis_carterae.AAC.1